ncbi:MAG: hypothetical protein J4400_06260 [Candidatus Aenigmarchaeota archaeon]|nr:hypothetical protein [Candidatus Aenigmarchaeota archaeon]
MGNEVVSRKDAESPAFKIQLFNTKTYRIVRENSVDKDTRKSLWCGRIQHIQSGRKKMFNTVAQMLKFIEDNRV